MSLILPMCAFALAASISPGPVNLVCLSSGTRYPVATGLTFVTGATLGFIVLFIAVGLGLYSLLAMVPGLQSVLRWVGVAFLLYFSIKLALDSGELPDAGIKRDLTQFYERNALDAPENGGIRRRGHYWLS